MWINPQHPVPKVDFVLYHQCPSGCGFMMRFERLRVLRVHYLLIMLATHTHSYGRPEYAMFQSSAPQ